jgi:hypothetical protein
MPSIPCNAVKCLTARQSGFIEVRDRRQVADDRDGDHDVPTLQA